ncbi:MAG: (Fe-S)-binding protein [Deltaproteobacteria bacterium]|nr:(Fe-S)-binding protein [Deltaproteobacteria bacterium]
MEPLQPARPFVEEACTRCGLCLSECPVMGLPPETARDEIERLIAGQPTRHVLRECTSCFACDHLCPAGCNPAELVLQRWHEQYEREGLPLRARYFTPHEALNFRSYVVERMPADERELLRRWSDLSPTDEILYPGCNLITAPFLTRTRALEGLEIRGTLDHCCGETYYRMGLFDEVRKVARRLERYFKTLRVKRVNLLCTAGCNMLTNVLPSFGVDFDFEVRPYLPVLLRRLESGELKLARRLEGTATIQESCYGRQLGNEYMDVPRRILERLGLRVVEQGLCRDRALCCGIAGGFAHDSGYHLLDVTRATLRSLLGARATGADYTVTYCAGCLQMLSAGRLLLPLGGPVYHILELLSKALGEETPHPMGWRARAFLTGTLRHQGPLTFSRRRYRVPEIPEVPASQETAPSGGKDPGT